MRTSRFETRPDTTTDYVVGPGARLDHRVGDALSDRPVIAVIDERVVARHRSRVDEVLAGRDVIGTLVIQGGEAIKTLSQLEIVLEFFEQRGLPKHGTVLAIGGGTVSDVVGLAAMLVRRSVALVLLPTTLLAQVDAAVGGKNGINTATTKNLIGHFHHPTVVACDQDFLPTLPRRQLVSGIAECIKVFAVADALALEAHAPDWDAAIGQRHGRDDLIVSGSTFSDTVWDAVRAKLSLLGEDPYELSSRRLLNYGHAFAHMFEERSSYRILHGEAVLLGMMIENEISAVMSIAGPAVATLQDMIAALVTPVCREAWIRFGDLGPELARLRQMRRNALNLVCLHAPGDATIIDDLPDEILAFAWRQVEERIMIGPVQMAVAGS